MEITKTAKKKTFRILVRIIYNVCKAICVALGMIVAGTQLMDGCCGFSVDY